MSELLLRLDPGRLHSTAGQIREELGASAVEVVARSSRARVVTFEYQRSGQLLIDSQGAQEAGHMVRAASDEEWGAWAGTGSPKAPEQAPAMARGQLRFPDPERIRELQAGDEAGDGSARSRTIERPLLGESDARRWIDRLVETATATLENDGGPKRAFHLRGRLEDGAAESLLVNSHGVEAPGRSRITGVRLELSVGTQTASTYLAADDDLQSSSSNALRELVQELDLQRNAVPIDSDAAASVLVRPKVLAPILAHLAMSCWRPTSPGAMDAPNESIGMEVWERPDLAPGFLGGERDGEGLFAQRRLIFDHDGLHPLVPWDRMTQGDEHSGFRWRASWRDLPRFGPSHLRLQTTEASPDPDGATGPDFEAIATQGALAADDDDLLLDVFGYRLRGGERTQPQRATLRLHGTRWPSRLAFCLGERQTQTLAACTVSCPSAVFDGLQLQGYKGPTVAG